LDSDIRVPEMKAAEVGRKQVSRDCGAGGDPQRPTLQPPQLPQLSLGGALHAEQFTSALIQRPSSGGEPDRSARSVKEIDVELTLELVQRFRDRRLAQMQLGCGARETSFLYDCGEQPEVMKIDSHNFFSSIYKDNVLAS